MTKIEMIRAPGTFRTNRTIVNSSPTRNRNWPGVVGKTGATIGAPPCGVAMKPPPTKPMNRMNRPMPAPIARLSDERHRVHDGFAEADDDEQRDDEALEDDDAHRALRRQAAPGQARTRRWR